MLYVSIKHLCIFALSLFLLGCNEDLTPSDKDLRETVQAGSIGHQAGQIALDFSFEDTEGNLSTLNDELAAHDAVVLYFTMWCPVCDSHMSSIRQTIKPNFPTIRFINVDYVSGSLSQARANQISSAYRSETVIADTNHSLTTQFKGDMGTTIVIDTNNVILMNEGFKQSKLNSALNLASQP